MKKKPTTQHNGNLSTSGIARQTVNPFLHRNDIAGYWEKREKDSEALKKKTTQKSNKSFNDAFIENNASNRGTGKTYRHHTIDLIIGQKGTGKTTLCLKHIKSYIADRKRNKKPYKIFIYCLNEEEYKSVKAKRTSRKIADIKRGIYFLSDAQISEIDKGKHNSLIVIDRNNDIPKFARDFDSTIREFVFTPRLHKYDVIITRENVSKSERLLSAASRVVLFNTLDNNSYLHNLSIQFSIATYMRVFVKRFEPIIIDIRNKTIFTKDSKAFKTSVGLKALSIASGRTVQKTLENNAKLILEYSKFWGGR